MSSTLLSLLPAVICMAMMFGAGAAIRLATRAPLRRMSFFARRDASERIERGSRSGA